MDTTPNLELPLVAAAQAQKHVTHNEALAILDALVQLSAVSRSHAEPPSGGQVDGRCYIVASPALEGWAGWEDSVAAWSAGTWVRLKPAVGWRAWIADEGVMAVWNGTLWQIQQAIGDPLLLGINTDADTSKRLSVKSDGVLFSHDDVTPGTGDLRIIANKAASQRTASLLFQSNWLGQVELGLAGSDDFSIRVSTDGISWIEALTIDPATGVVSLPATSSQIRILTAEDTSGTVMPDNVYVDQVFTSTTRNDFGSSAWDGSVFTVPEDGTYDFGVSLGVEGSPSATSTYFLRNGSIQHGFSEISGSIGQNTIGTRVVVTLAAGEVISVQMRHNDGAVQPGLTSAIFSVIKL